MALRRYNRDYDTDRETTTRLKYSLDSSSMKSKIHSDVIQSDFVVYREDFIYQENTTGKGRIFIINGGLDKILLRDVSGELLHLVRKVIKKK